MRIKDSLLNRLEKAKQSKTFAALLLFELLLVLSLLVGGAIYLSPNINLIPSPLNKYLFVSDLAGLLAGAVIILYVLNHKDFVKQTAKEKLHVAKTEPRVPALLVMEFFLVMVLVLATFIYLDPEYNILPWPFNVLVFLAVLAIVAYLYHYSKPFRKESRNFFAIRKRW